MVIKNILVFFLGVFIYGFFFGRTTHLEAGKTEPCMGIDSDKTFCSNLGEISSQDNQDDFFAQGSVETNFNDEKIKENCNLENIESCRNIAFQMREAGEPRKSKLYFKKACQLGDILSCDVMNLYYPNI